MSKKVLVLGATGAMGRYLVPCLAEMGYQVDGVSVEDKVSDLPNVNYIKANAKDKTVLASLLKNGYDGIVDFMWYPTGELPFAVPRMMIWNIRSKKPRPGSWIPQKTFFSATPMITAFTKPAARIF